LHLNSSYAIVFSEEHAGGGCGGMYHENFQYESRVDLKYFLSVSHLDTLCGAFFCHFGAVLLHFYCIKNIKGDLLCSLFKVFILCLWSSRRFSSLIFQKKKFFLQIFYIFVSPFFLVCH